ncbi:N-acyl homoserine lactonase [Xenorhabdus sp. Reich]|uniref:N-acyl homoserine lactonase n=1 Tax=Xenorhabdus littoralis TaxID=2582835 RepID=A0ABU4SHS6_9GAMM|nr:N-acyl homoserine lactonase [Xenorhabdus sp. Reich]MDX7998196.1 N-acyl homoserine lactonase [Xenorhabdus sp. Reich]
MNRIIFLISLFLLLPQISFSKSTQLQTGSELIASLDDRYRDNRSNCGDENSPAFLCSGILLRGTVPSDNYHSWNPSPHSQESGGVSFSYLRHDSKLITLDAGYQNGFIFSPYASDSEGKIHPEVLCYFPANADSVNRDNHGCGIYMGMSQGESCQQQGITTVQQWIQNYNDSGQDDSAQCGFDVKLQTSGNADAFMQGVQARLQLQLTENNEAILATWPQDIPNQLPIEAFFYLSRNDGGLQGAQHDQKDFYNSTGKVIPIVKIELPPDYNQSASFTYYTSDQVINN